MYMHTLWQGKTAVADCYSYICFTAKILRILNYLFGLCKLSVYIYSVAITATDEWPNSYICSHSYVCHFTSCQLVHCNGNHMHAVSSREDAHTRNHAPYIAIAIVL